MSFYKFTYIIIVPQDSIFNICKHAPLSPVARNLTEILDNDLNFGEQVLKGSASCFLQQRNIKSSGSFEVDIQYSSVLKFLLMFSDVVSGSSPGTLWLMSDQSTVEFTSDDYNNLMGFNATYTAADTSNLSGKPTFHLFLCLFLPSFIILFITSFLCSFNHLLLRPLVTSFLHSFVRSLLCLFVCSFLCSFVSSFVCYFVYSFINPFLPSSLPSFLIRLK